MIACSLFLATSQKYCIWIQTPKETSHQIKASIFTCFFHEIKTNIFTCFFNIKLKIPWTISTFSQFHEHTFRSSRLQIFFKIGALKDFRINKNWQYSELTRMRRLDRWIERKQLDIMSTYHYVQNQRKLVMQSQDNGQKSQYRQFFDDFEVNISKLHIFLKNSSSNVRPKTKQIVGAVFEKNIWFWANLETFSQISPNQEYF